MALTVLPPICKATVGEPDVVLSVWASEKWAVTVTTSPALRALFCTPTALVICTSINVAGEVLTTKLPSALPTPKLPALSVNKSLLTVMLALPPVKPCVGKNVAVRVRPVPLMADKVPLTSVTSPAEPFHVKELPGSSLKVKVMSAVSPLKKVLRLLLMLTTVGAVVSTK